MPDGGAPLVPGPEVPELVSEPVLPLPGVLGMAGGVSLLGGIVVVPPGGVVVVASPGGVIVVLLPGGVVVVVLPGGVVVVVD